VQVVIIDAAPTDLKQIDHTVQLATDATKDKDLPAARILLAAVISELRIRTTSLPLATYPEALKRAAQLLDQGKNRDAGDVLLTALNTLVIVDHVLPLPLVLAQAAIDDANSQRQNNKQLALTLLEAAKNEIIRSRHLGYLSEDAEYKALDDEISNLESSVKGPGNTTSLFAQLRERIAAFINRQKQHANQ
jgi:YfdX protein